MTENRGGRRPGQKDAAPRQTAARKLAAMAAAQGVQPLDVLLTTMRRGWHRAEELEAREASPKLIAEQREIASIAAVRAAPYLHPRLAAVAVQHVPSAARFDLSRLSDEEHRTLRQLMLRARRPVIEAHSDVGRLPSQETNT